MNAWQNIFRQSRVNDGVYLGDKLPAQIWQWPSGTWFQKRLRYLRKGNRHEGNLLEMSSR